MKNRSLNSKPIPMTKKLLTLLFLFSLTLSASAAGEGTVALSFLRINQDPASAAMGDVSLRNNPASDVWQTGHGEAGLSWQKWTPDASSFISAGGFGRFAGRFAARAFFSKQSETPYDLYDENAQESGSFTPGAFKAGAGLSVRITDQWSAGIQGCYASRSLAPGSQIGAFAADAAVMGVFGAFSLAGGAKALGGSVQSASGERFSLPASVFLSSGYLASFGDKHALLAALEAEYFFYGAPAVQAGLEYSWNQLIQVRGGYHYGGLIPSHASAGLGLNLRGFKLHFTYLVGSGGIGGSMLIGAGYRF